MRTLRVGIIGCGVIGPTHADAFAACDGVELAWACDLVDAKAAALAETFPVKRISTEYREVLADPSVDAITICTDHASHSEIAVAAMEQGKHVLCEKALAATRAGLDRMFAAHRAHADLAFGCVFQHRFDATFRYLKQWVDEGRLGTILTAGVQARCLRTQAYYTADKWRGTWDGEGGAVLINQAIHFIDMLAWIMGGVESLCGQHVNLTHQGVIETEDTAVAALRFTGGALGTLEATCSSHERWAPTVFVVGSEGTVEIRNGEAVKASFEDAAFDAEAKAAFRACRERRETDVGKSYYGTGHRALIGDFVEAVRTGRAPFVTAASARHAVDIVLGLYESHRSQGWVTL